MTHIYIFSLQSCQQPRQGLSAETNPLPPFGLTKKVTILLIFRPLWQQIRFEFQYSLALPTPQTLNGLSVTDFLSFHYSPFELFLPATCSDNLWSSRFLSLLENYKMPHTSQLSPKRAVLKFPRIKVGQLFEVSWPQFSSPSLLLTCKNHNSGTFCLHLEEFLNEPLWLLTPEIGISKHNVGIELT